MTTISNSPGIKVDRGPAYDVRARAIILACADAATQNQVVGELRPQLVYLLTLLVGGINLIRGSNSIHFFGKGTSLVLRWLCVTLRYILTFCVTTYGLYCRVRTLSDSRMYLRYTRALRPPPAGGLRERAK